MSVYRIGYLPELYCEITMPRFYSLKATDMPGTVASYERHVR